MFKSARIQLTFFYLIAIALVSFLTTFGIRVIAENAFENNNLNARTQISEIVRQEVGLPFLSTPLAKVQQHQDKYAHNQIIDWTIYINVIAIIAGVPLSYWFAGRTLKPIEKAHKQQVKFASDASHELNTPLSIMKTENEVFLRQKSFSESEARQQINSNLEEIQRLELLTKNLLALSDLDSDEKIKLSPIKSTEVSLEAIKQFNKSFDNVSSKIKVEVDDKKIIGNLESLSQILVIFLDNAIKYSPAETEVNLVGKSVDNSYVFSVIDKGPGISRKDMPLIFERLYRGDMNRSSKTPGHGLGLALAKEIANANHSGLSVSNNPDKGATFTLSVNLYKDNKSK